MARVALDVMGGDNAPDEIIKGAAAALEKSNNIDITLVGKEDIILKKLDEFKIDKSRFNIVNASEVIETGDSPVESIRAKKDSSLVVCMNLVKEGKADALVSAGSSGAILVGGQVIVGRVKGVLRAPLAPIIPSSNGPVLLIDCGANVDARSAHLVQFARMGSIYMNKIMHIDKPRVAIVNIGLEEEKGNALVKETYPLLKEQTDINFIGSIEAREIPRGGADVVVCEAFTGNVILKMYEGVGSVFLSKIKGALMTNLKTKIGALLIKKTLKSTLSEFDSSRYGGAPLLGLKGLVVKTHGNAKAKEICNSILQCEDFYNEHIGELIEESINN